MYNFSTKLSRNKYYVPEFVTDYFKGIGCGSLGAETRLNFKAFLPLYIKYTMSPYFPTDYSFRYMQEKIIKKEDLANSDKDNERDIAKYLSNIYAMEKLIKIEVDLSCLRGRIEQRSLTIEVIGMKIGDYILVSYPNELFAQIGLNIKKNSQTKILILLEIQMVLLDTPPLPMLMKVVPMKLLLRN